MGLSRRRVCADVLSKYRTRTARRVSVLRSVLSSIITENGPLLQRAITGLVTSTAKHLFTIIVVFVRRHLNDFAMPLPGWRNGQRWLRASYAQQQNSQIWRLGLGLEKSGQRHVLESRLRILFVDFRLQVHTNVVYT